MRSEITKYAIARLEAMNADNRMVLEALESGRIGTGEKVLGDTTEQTKAAYRARVAELDDLIAKIHAGSPLKVVDYEEARQMARDLAVTGNYASFGDVDRALLSMIDTGPTRDRRLATLFHDPAVAAEIFALCLAARERKSNA
jgi:hypothetical protein